MKQGQMGLRGLACVGTGDFAESGSVPASFFSRTRDWLAASYASCWCSGAPTTPQPPSWSLCRRTNVMSTLESSQDSTSRSSRLGLSEELILQAGLSKPLGVQTIQTRRNKQTTSVRLRTRRARCSGHQTPPAGTAAAASVSRRRPAGWEGSIRPSATGRCSLLEQSKREWR